jgi:uncharacterized membrane protein
MKPEANTDGGSSDPAGELPDSVARNIDAVARFYEAEERKISGPQDFIEKTSSFVGRPGYLAFIVAFIALWVIGNLLANRLGWAPFDAPPFFWLQGIVSLYALLISTAVLIRQERAARLAEQRAHLDLQVNLLTEGKVAKVIELLEELRRDLPNVADRHDPEVESMQTPANPHAVLSALETQGANKQPG